MYNIRMDYEPFSVFGSFMSFGRANGNQGFDEGLYLKSAHYHDQSKGIYRVKLLKDGKEIDFNIRAVPGLLTLENKEAGALCEVTYYDADTLFFRVTGCTVLLKIENMPKYLTAYPAGGKSWELIDAAYKHRLTVLDGEAGVMSSWGEYRAGGLELKLNTEEKTGALFTYEEYENVRDVQNFVRRFDECANKIAADYENFLGRMPSVPEKYEEARKEASYIDWSCVVSPKGHYKRNSMLMSKNWMIQLWSWDHMFNALALMNADPELAWDQVMAPFDHQDAFGSLPDSVNDSSIVRTFVKPPIHGVMLRYMQQNSNMLTAERIRGIYKPLDRWTDWWFRYRDFDGDGIPQYNHGNDSGWDNATPFQLSPTLEGADLSAFLVIQLEVLGDFAEILGLPDDAKAYRERATALYERLMKHFLRDGRLRAMVSGTHEYAAGDSLFDVRPIVLGKRLDKEIAANMVKALGDEKRFLTKFGFATESISSEFYYPDGYWRGPVWAPEMFFMSFGLEQLGEMDLAREAARRFCDCCAKSGMAENYNAITGEGLRDKAYTWTSSVFLLLANKYLND